MNSHSYNVDKASTGRVDGNVLVSCCGYIKQMLINSLPCKSTAFSSHRPVAWIPAANRKQPATL